MGTTLRVATCTITTDEKPARRRFRGDKRMHICLTYTVRSRAAQCDVAPRDVARRMLACHGARQWTKKIRLPCPLRMWPGVRRYGPPSTYFRMPVSRTCESYADQDIPSEAAQDRYSHLKAPSRSRLRRLH